MMPQQPLNQESVNRHDADCVFVAPAMKCRCLASIKEDCNG